MAETKYGKYIITEMKSNLKLPAYSPDPSKPCDEMTRVLYLDNEVLEGSFFLSSVWFWKKSGQDTIKAHTHNFDEVVAFFGTNPEDPHDLCGEVEFWLGDEKHILTKTCLIFVPKGLKHCPLIINRADRPIFHFTTGPSRLYR